MINISDLRDNIDLYKEKLVLKGYIGDISALNQQINTKNALQNELDELKNKKNSISKEIGILASKGEGIDKLKADSFNTMNIDKATDYLTDMGRTEFFEHVRGTTTVTLYNDKETWKLLGYEGYSSDKGGYINRGFNDLDWLPEPRIEEHPDLAAFLSESPTRFAEIKKMIAKELN